MLLSVLGVSLSGFGAATIPQEERCAAVFVGTVKSARMVRVQEEKLSQGKWTKRLIEEIWQAEVEIESRSKLNTPLLRTATVYYEQPPSSASVTASGALMQYRVCPGYPCINVGQTAKFFCVTHIEGTNEVFFIPEVGWVQDAEGVKPSPTSKGAC